MLYLSDTHPLVWYVSGQHRRLGKTARRVFARAETGRDEVRISAISLFEVLLLLEGRRLSSTEGWEAWTEAVRNMPGLAVETLQLDDIARAREVSGLVDPFDRLIVGTALRLGVALITANERIAQSGLVRVIR